VAGLLRVRDLVGGRAGGSLLRQFAKAQADGGPVQRARRPSLRWKVAVRSGAQAGCRWRSQSSRWRAMRRPVLPGYQRPAHGRLGVGATRHVRGGGILRPTGRPQTHATANPRRRRCWHMLTVSSGWRARSATMLRGVLPSDSTVASASASRSTPRFRGGCAAVGLSGLPDGDQPRLRTRPSCGRQQAESWPPRHRRHCTSNWPSGRRPGHLLARSRPPTASRRSPDAKQSSRRIADRLSHARVVVLHGAPGPREKPPRPGVRASICSGVPGRDILRAVRASHPIPSNWRSCCDTRPAPPSLVSLSRSQCRRALRELGAAGRALLILRRAIRRRARAPRLAAL